MRKPAPRTCELLLSPRPAPVLAAAACEARRLKLYQADKILPPEIAVLPGEPQPPVVVDMSMMAQIPQYILVGAAQSLISVAEADFFYSISTPSIRSLCVAMRLGSTALGGYFASAEVKVVKSLTNWIPDDINEGRLDNFYYFLTTLLGLNFCVFLVVARYSPLTRNPTDAHAVAKLDDVAVEEYAEAPAAVATQDIAPSPYIAPSEALTMSIKSQLDELDEGTRRAILKSLLAAET